MAVDISNLPENITDIPGMSEWEKYNGVTVNGQHYTPSQIEKDEGLREYVTGRADTIYESVNGGFTADPSKGVSSFSWDNNTGKIKISAPKTLRESDWFKDNFLNSSNFKALASAFHNDPTGTSSLVSYDKDGNEKTRTIQEYLDDYKKAFDDYAAEYPKIASAREEVLKTTGNGIKLSDEDVYVWAHSTKRDSDKFDSNKVVYIPNIAMNYFDFSKLPSWNDTYKTISAKDFYEWYNLDDGTEGKDKIIDQLTDVTAQMYNQYNKTQRNIEADEEGKKAAANDYARTVSFLRTLQNDNPEANVLTSTRLFLESTATSFVDNIAQTTGNIVLGVSDIIDGLDAADEEIVPLKLVTEPLKFTRGLYRTGELMFYNLGATITGIDISAANNQLGEVALLGNISESVADGDADGLVEILSKNMGLSRELNARDLANTQHELLLEAHNDLTKLSSAATAGSIVGGLAAEVVKQIMITNALGSGVGNAVTGSVVGAEGLAAITSGTSTLEDVIAGMHFLKSGLTAKQLAGAVKLGSLSANLVTQGLSDTILNDEYALRKMFVEGDTKDAIEAVNMNILFNGIGELSGLATTKGWDAFTKTSVGQAVEAFEQRTVAKIQYRKQRALGAVADKLNAMKKGGDEAAEWYSKWAKAEANASEKIAHAGKYAEEGETITQATKRLVDEKIDMEYAFTRIATQQGRTVLGIQTNPNVAKQFVDTQNKAAKVIDLEGAAGVKNQGKQLFTQETSDYIYFTKRAQELAHKETLKTNEQEFLESINKKIENFKNTHSAELISAIDDYVHSLERYYYSFRNFMVENGIIDKETLKSQRDSGLWGKDGMEYIHLQTMSGADQVKSAKELVEKISKGKNYKADISFDQYSYKVGDVDVHALDPQLTLISEQIGVAKVIDSKEWGDALLKTQPLSQEVDLNGNPVTSKELNNLRKAVNYSANDVIDSLTKNDDINRYYFANMYKLQENTSGRILKKQQKIEKLLGMDDARLKQTALNLDSADLTVLEMDLNIPTYETVRTQAQLDEVYKNASKSQKAAIDNAMGAGELNVKNYNDAIKNFDLGDQLERLYISESKEILGSNVYKKYATDLRKQQLTARQQTILNDSEKKIRALRKEAKLVELGEDEFTEVVVKFTDHVTDEIVGSLKNNKMFNDAIQKFVDKGIDKETATRYLALDSLKKELASDRKTFSKALEKNLGNLDTSGNLNTKQKIRYTKAIKEAVSDNVNSEWTDAVKALKSSGAGELVDTKALFEDIRNAMKDIIDTKIKSPNVIQVLDKDGVYKLYEVSPVTAELYNSRPNFSNIKNSGLVRFFNQTNRIFRIMTTGWGLSSFENQWMRDPLNAYVMGGMNRGLKTNTEEIGRLLGPNLTESMQKELDEMGWGDLAKDIPEGSNIGETVAQNIRQTAENLYGGTSEATLYYRKMANVRKETLFGDYEESIGKMEKALRTMEDHSLGNFRETYLRKNVYMNSYKKALDMGKTTKEAARIAEFTADNATTDFSRAFSWGNKLTNSVPYLGAAINGSKSFWRLLEIDPVGVSGRFFSGLVIPTMALTAQSLANDNNREVYKNIPEYMKQDNICFVVDGEVFKIPIPQELSAFVAPFRQVVEKANDGSDEAWRELLMSDILSISPVDLSGFADLDDPLGKDEDFWSRLSNEAEELISQLSPVAVKTAYMAVTGRDPFTHSSIDKENTFVDADGNLQIMDNEDNALAKWFSSVCKGFAKMTGNQAFSLSPSAAEALLSNFFGQASVDLFGSLGNLFSGDMVGALSVYGKQVTKPFTAGSYDQADLAWKELVKERQAEKQELLNNNSDLSKLYQNLMYATDPEKIKTLRAQIRQITQDYQDKVFNDVQKFNSIYGSNYDYKKFASTINLLNFTTRSGNNLSDGALEDAKELANDNRYSALMTMSEMGFNSTNDMSIFGYLKTNADGSTEWIATLPTAIAYSSMNSFYTGVDETSAKLTNYFNRTVYSNGKSFKDAYDEMWAKANAYANAGQLDARDKVLKDWDVQVMMGIYPILAENDLLDQYGNSILDNRDIITLLDKYIRVPSDFMGKGKYISSSSGLDKNRGYAKAYIQKIYNQLKGGK